MSRLYAIGDIHGHFTELQVLYQRLLDDGMVPERDHLVFLGDYVDGGPKSRQVVDQLITWHQEHPHWVFLKGNHEDLMLDALVYGGRKYGDYYLWWNQGGRETALSYLPEDATAYERAIMQPDEFISTSHLEWLNNRPLMHETGQFLFVHAGFQPGYYLNAQTEENMLWIREAFYRQRYNFGKPVVFGHTPFEVPQVIFDYRAGHEAEIVAIGIDTMFHDFGRLSAVRLDPAAPHAVPRFLFSEAVAGKAR
jgi:serine/threonine protein phosphatase 1